MTQIIMPFQRHSFLSFQNMKIVYKKRWIQKITVQSIHILSSS